MSEQGIPADNAAAGSVALEADTIAAGYTGKPPVFADLSLKLKRGSILAVIGPNGSGKTTLFRALTGELPLQAGKVRIAGTQRNDEAWIDIHRLSPRARALRLSRVLQNERSAWAVPVADYVEAGLFAGEGWFSHDPVKASRKVKRSLEAVGIAQLADRPVTELSGGEFRRVVIARALVQDTDIILLDEPTADLDLAHQMETLELLLGLAASGKAVAFSVHDLNQAAMVADEILLLAGGGTAAFGSPSEVLTPEIIGKTYGTRVIVRRHPVADIPQIIPDPDWIAGRSGS
ncbi:MAG: ABC transporter ATP-binding protein [Spirochaetes bacterium]|nr:ABC transporter ATP-binding protein [Spirochaetota bacterium]